MMQPPEAAAPPPARPAVQPLYRPSLNWPMQLYSYFPASELISHLLLAMGATMLALKLSGETLSGNSDTAMDGTTAGWWYIGGIMCTGHALCAAVNYAAYRQWRAWPHPANPLLRCLRMRGVCEAAYSCLQHVGLCLVVARLPAYVADAIRRAEAGGAGFGSLSGIDEDGEPEPLGIHVNEGAAVSINVIMGPLWAAWLAQECVSIFFDASRAAVPNIDNDELRHQLASILKNIRIRPRGQVFMFNVQLSFCARMLDNAYRVSWRTLFILAWLSFTFMICSLCCLGVAFFAGYFIEAMEEATHIYRRLLCSSLRTVVMALCAVVPICCNFAFSLTLARRLDGDESIGSLKILLPFIIGHLAAALMMALSMSPARGATQAAALAGSALGLPMGPFHDMLDSSALLPRQIGQPGAAAAQGGGGGGAAGLGLFAVAEAVENAEGGRGGGLLEAERLRRWEVQMRVYEPNAPTELLRRADGGSALYRARADVNCTQSGSTSTQSADGAAAAGAAAAADSASAAAAGPEAAAGSGALAGVDLADDVESSVEQLSGSSFGVCQICFDDELPANTVLLPCGHGGLCRTCGWAVAMKPPHLCHMCRGVVLKVATVEPRGVDCETGLQRFEVVPTPPPPPQPEPPPASSPEPRGAGGGGSATYRP